MAKAKNAPTPVTAEVKKEKLSEKRKRTNREQNDERHLENKNMVAQIGLSSETVTRSVQRISRKGKKTFVDIITIEKKKRPSKLLRKYNRRMLEQKKPAKEQLDMKKRVEKVED